MTPTSEGPAVTWHLEKHDVGYRGSQDRANQEPLSPGLGSFLGCQSVRRLVRESRPRSQQGNHLFVLAALRS